MHYSFGPFSNYTINGYAINGGVSLGPAYMAGQRFIIEKSLANASADYSPRGGSGTEAGTKIWGGTISAGLTGNFAVRYVLTSSDFLAVWPQTAIFDNS